MTLVSAPAGYGKTATIASWAAGRSEHVAWLSCDPTDVEPTRFMSCLLSAIAARWPGVADDAFVLLDREGASTHDPAVAVANELATVDTPGVIVVDDLHLAAPSPAVLTAFIDALPEGFRFVAGTRSDPPLSLARLRLHGDLLELRSDDLRFGTQEMADFFALQDVPLTSGELLRLHELTEGWPAAVQLAAIALQRGVPCDDFLQAFAGTDRAVGDFLVSEVLASLAPELVDFLVETSVLDAFDADLCKAVTGSDEAAHAAGATARRRPLRGAARRPGALVPLPPPVRRLPARPAGVDGRAPGSPRPTSGRRRPSRTEETSRDRCSTPWRSATSRGPGRSSIRRSVDR